MGPMIGVLFDGFAYGMLLFLLSVGLSVTLGMMNFVNLAHCSFAMLGGYVTVTLINAAKGLKWESPRGPISIDPETRDVIQNVYIRKVEKVGGKLVNVVIATVPNVKNPVAGK